MSTATDTRRQVRIVGSETSARGVHETVNVITDVSADTHHSIKEHQQVLAAAYNAQPQHLRNEIDTLIDGGGGLKNVRTIFISGYGGPS